MTTAITHANSQHHHLYFMLPPVTIQVNSNKDINIDGIAKSIINITNANL